ncbi:MAG TPA: response regulator [Gammaproteobacteria bacterium]|jgi:two-component system KDP operon response regulator KdpE|nr:response regulator [Gammaproteobacteria bacterium]
MSETHPVVLLVEDDAPIRHFVRTALESEGMAVHEAAGGREALVAARSRKPELLVLDLGLPDMDGVEVVKELRRWSGMPILVLSARHQEDAKIATLDAGADDYLTKPFNVGELLARVRAALRRARGATTQPSDYRSDGLEVDLEKRRVVVAGFEVHLTPIEFRLLTSLVQHTGRVVTHRQLLKEVWGPDHVEDNHYVRIYMAQLRHKLEEDPAQPRYLLTEAGVGYRLAEAKTD